MKREDLENFSKNELIEIILSQQEQLLTLAAELAKIKAQLNMNSTNSSKPPSSDLWKKPQTERKKSGKKPGGQPGHKGHGLKIDREPDEIIALKPTVCEQCSADICDAEGTIEDSRYKIDVKIQTIITRYDQLEVVCPACEATNIGQFPEGISSRVQYGEGVRGVCVLLTHYAMVGYDKTYKILNDVFGVPIRAGTIANHVNRNFRSVLLPPHGYGISEASGNNFSITTDQQSVIDSVFLAVVTKKTGITGQRVC